VRITPSRMDQIAEAVMAPRRVPTSSGSGLLQFVHGARKAAATGVTWVRRRPFTVRRLRLSVWEGLIIGFDLKGHGPA
jgi:hypothetical protein